MSARTLPLSSCELAEATCYGRAGQLFLEVATRLGLHLDSSPVSVLQQGCHVTPAQVVVALLAAAGRQRFVSGGPSRQLKRGVHHILMALSFWQWAQHTCSTGKQGPVVLGQTTPAHFVPHCRAVNASLPSQGAAGSPTSSPSAATEDISIASASSAEGVARWVVVFQDDTPDSEIAQYCSSSAATYGFTCKTQLNLLLKAIVTEVRLVHR